MSDYFYKETLPDINDYWELFLTTGWNERYNFKKNDLKNAIRNSWYTVSAYDKDKLVGFGRVISDGTHHAFIVDMIIHPDFQGKGIGRSLLEKLLYKCKSNNIPDIQLFAAKDKYGFYEKFNFAKRPDNAPGMQFDFGIAGKEEALLTIKKS